MSTAPKIAIVGGGPGGLTLAALLKRAGVPFSIFEHDASRHARVSQGGTLDLQRGTGQQAMREAGLWSAFVAGARPEADVYRIVTLQGEVKWDGNAMPRKAGVADEDGIGTKPEIDRGTLTEILLDAVTDDAVTWGKKLVQARQPAGAGGKYELQFADGSVEGGFDVVVGADGAWSKVRKLLTPADPYYSGICLLELWAMDPAGRHKFAADFTGSGNMFSFGPDRMVASQRQGDGSIRTYVCLRKPENFFKECGIDWTKPDEARRQFVDTYLDTCGADLRRLVLESDDYQVTRSLYMFDIGFKWDGRPCVTLLGDAAHLMTPFAGVGVNAAMADALALSRELIKHFKDPESLSLADAVRQYEKDMFPRGEAFAQQTWEGLVHHFGPNGTETMAARLRAEYEEA